MVLALSHLGFDSLGLGSVAVWTRNYNQNDNLKVTSLSSAQRTETLESSRDIPCNPRLPRPNLLGCFYTLGVLFVGVLMVRALLLRDYV